MFNNPTLRKNVIAGYTGFDCINQHFGYRGIETSVLNGCFMEYEFYFRSKFLGGISFEIYLCHMVIYRVFEKLHLGHLFGNGLLAYIFTAVAVICGSVVFSVCAKWFLNKIETFLKERVRRVNHV